MTISTGPKLGQIISGAPGDPHFAQLLKFFRSYEALAQPTVKSRVAAVPTSGMVNGDLYLLTAAPNKDSIARYYVDANVSPTSGWEYFAPFDGMYVWSTADQKGYRYKLVGGTLAWTVYADTVPIQDEGSPVVAAPTAINFTGSGVAVTNVGGIATVTISGDVLIAQPNLLINADFSLNQRTFAGGALAAGNYGHDRWGAYNGGANYSASGETITLTSGALCQVIESPGLAGQQITVSVEDPSATVTVTIGNGTGIDSATGTITAGSGRRGITLAVPAGVTGDVKIRLGGTAVSFKRVKVEVGAVATPWATVDRAVEQLRASRFFVRLTGNSGERGEVGMVTTSGSTPVNFGVMVGTGTRMRATPALTHYGMSVFLAGEGSPRSVTSFPASPRVSAAGVFVFLQVDGSAPAASATVGALRWGASPSYLQFDAELACTD